MTKINGIKGRFGASAHSSPSSRHHWNSPGTATADTASGWHKVSTFTCWKALHAAVWWCLRDKQWGLDNHNKYPCSSTSCQKDKTHVLYTVLEVILNAASINSVIIHPFVNANLYDFLSLVEHKKYILKILTSDTVFKISLCSTAEWVRGEINDWFTSRTKLCQVLPLPLLLSIPELIDHKGQSIRQPYSSHTAKWHEQWETTLHAFIFTRFRKTDPAGERIEICVQTSTEDKENKGMSSVKSNWLLSYRQCKHSKMIHRTICPSTWWQ